MMRRSAPSRTSTAAPSHGAGTSRPSALALATAGIGVVGTAYGMARYGYGLLLPDIRRDYGLSTAALGAIAAASYAAYLAGSVGVGALAGRVGLRSLVLAGGASAVAGMTLAGLSSGPGLLVAGVLVAGVSAAFALPPFIDAAEAYVAPERRARTLGSISSGTGWGVALAAPLAIAAGSAWRSAWLAFAVVGVLATAWAVHVLPRGARGATACELPRLRLGWFVCPRSGPLLAGALLVGLGASLYWTFAVDFLVTGGALDASGGRLLLVVVGVASVLGAGAGGLAERLGSRPAFALLSWALGLSLALLALAPDAPVLAVVSGVLFGSAYNLLVAIQTLWSVRVFADRPGTGVAAVMFILGGGLLIGPLVAGPLAAVAGMEGVFTGAAILLALTALLAPREPVTVAAARA
jgi:predicted MFS family arabinose efflux permease